MPSIVSYRPYTDAEITRTLRLPEDAQHQRLGTELCTLEDGLAYVSLPDGAELPKDQPTEIAATIQPVTLTDTLRAAIKAASPHVRLINQRVVERIRARYRVEDEIKMIRLAPSPESAAYNDYVEECRAWGADQKAGLGL